MKSDEFAKGKHEPEKNAGWSGTDESENLRRQIEEGINKQRKAGLSVIWLFVILSATSIPLYMNSHAENYLQLLTPLGFLISALYLINRNRFYSAIDTGLTGRKFFEEAERRFQLNTAKDWLVIVPSLLFIGIGSGIHITERLMKYTDNSLIIYLIWALIFSAICVFGFVVSKKNWKNEYEQLLNEIKRIKRTF